MEERRARKHYTTWAHESNGAFGLELSLKYVTGDAHLVQPGRCMERSQNQPLRWHKLAAVHLDKCTAPGESQAISEQTV